MGDPPASGMGEVLTSSHRKNWLCYEAWNTCLGRGLVLWYDLSNEKGILDLVSGMLGAFIGQVHIQQLPGNWQDIYWM